MPHRCTMAARGMSIPGPGSATTPVASRREGARNANGASSAETTDTTHEIARSVAHTKAALRLDRGAAKAGGARRTGAMAAATAAAAAAWAAVEARPPLGLLSRFFLVRLDKE